MRFVVTFPQKMVSCNDVQYINGGWMREVNFRSFFIQRIGFWKKQWVVQIFTGADTAALGGGTCYYDEFSPRFDSEYYAIKFLAGITDRLVDEWESGYGDWIG